MHINIKNIENFTFVELRNLELISFGSEQSSIIDKVGLNDEDLKTLKDIQSLSPVVSGTVAHHCNLM